MKTNLGRLMVLVPALGSATLASAQQWPVGEPTWYYPEPSQMMWMWSGGLSFGWIFPLLALGLMVAVGVGVFLMVHRTHWHASHHWMPWHLGPRGSPSGDPTRTALRILNERFAKGEISNQEYEEKKAAIASGSPRLV